MSHDEFKARVARIEKTKAAERRAVTGGMTPWIYGGIWGLVFGVVLAFTNTNYERLKADAAADPAMEPLFYGLLAFLALSLLLFIGGLLRRRLNKKFRERRGWGLVLGFLIGVALSGIALRMTGDVDWESLLRL